VDKIHRLIYVTLGDATTERLSTELSVRVSPEALLVALVKQAACSVDELAEMDLPFELIKLLFEQSDEYKLTPKYIAIAEMDESIIPNDVERAILEQYVKHKGEIWVIHRNDADPHPSDPHAHNYEACLKLHLGNGDLYKKTTVVGNVGKKALLALREKISNIELPPLAT
jgi:hypothetical protein